MDYSVLDYLLNILYIQKYADTMYGQRFSLVPLFINWPYF